MKPLILAVALSLAWCDRSLPEPVPEPPQPTPEPTSPKPVPARGTCSSVCQHFADLDCVESLPTPDGATCVEYCDNTQRSPAPLDLACIDRATSCEQARLCE